MKETEENYIRRKCLERLKDNPEAGVMDFQEGIYAGIEYDKNKYSEEDMKKAFKVGFIIGYGSDVHAIDERNKTCEEWFEKIKKE
jgi:hypothetical protein